VTRERAVDFIVPGHPLRHTFKVVGWVQTSNNPQEASKCDSDQNLRDLSRKMLFQLHHGCMRER
jgi:hypothetical protein